MELLILDDDFLVLETLRLALERTFDVQTASTLEQALALMERETISGALIDINLNGGQRGIDFLKAFRKRHPNKPAIMASGMKDIGTVVKCMRLGADDYVEKPFDEATLRFRISKAFADKERDSVLRRIVEKTTRKSQIVGESELIRQAKRSVERGGPMRILLQGETGVGKTPFALYSNLIVSEMQGQMRPFEQVNCAGLNREMFQDQLFGHRRGGFTGAIADKQGLVALAEGGDLFLDEIGEMPLDVQALFLTFLDSSEYYPLGDDRKKKANVRIISATNRDLKAMVVQGKFRKDLYSRLSQIVVNIPPLRNRPSDIKLFFEHFVEELVGYAKPYDPEVVELLSGYAWEEGNVRELKDAVEYLCVMARDSEVISVEHVDDRYRPVTSVASVDEQFGRILPVAKHGLENCLSAVERAILEHYYKASSGVVEDMAKTLSVPKPTLYRKLKRYQVIKNENGPRPFRLNSENFG